MSSYQFPVYLLGLPGTDLERLVAIEAWCTVRAGQLAIGDDGEGEDDLRDPRILAAGGAEYAYADKIAEGAPASGAADTWEMATLDAKWVILGQNRFNTSGGQVKHYIQQFRTAETWIALMKNRFGEPSLVRIGRDLLQEQMECLRGGASTSLGYRQLSVLCAVNCAIGDKEVPFRVTRDFIRAVSVGFKSGKDYFLPGGKVSPKGQAAIEACHNGLAFPTVQQVRDDLSKLEERGLIGRVTVSRRVTAFYRADVCERASALEWLKKELNPRKLIPERREAERRIRNSEATGNAGVKQGNVGATGYHMLPRLLH